MSIAGYTPATILPQHWDPIADFVRTAVTDTKAANPTSLDPAKLMCTLAAYTDWATRIACMPLDRTTLFDRDLIADYIAHGCDRLSPTTLGTIRSRLLRISEACLPLTNRVNRLPPVHRDRTLAPYDHVDQLRLRSWAENHVRESARITSRAIIALGLGAGLKPAEMMNLRARDIQVDTHGVLLHIRGDRARQVPVLADWEQPLVVLTIFREPDQWAIATGRTATTSKNWLNAYISRRNTPGSLRPQTARMRNTWLFTHMLYGTPLGPLGHAAGLETFRTIEKLLPFLPETAQDKARQELRQPVGRA